MQRLRIRFSRGEELKYISHLDMTRLWQRALARAGIAIAYSEGFNPHPRLSLAAPLPLGVTSEAELMDIVLAKFISPHSFNTSVSRQLPGGIRIDQVYQMPLEVQSLQSQVRFAEYSVNVATDKPRAEIEAAIAGLLAKTELPWQHMRDTGPHHYDLRKLIEDLWLIDWRASACTLGMLVQSGSGGAGRPEQVTLALGFAGYPQAVHRTKLTLEAR
ncbi:MAG: TIGR03936 family radical SAM-associated protein [Dehalococcoidales bacterium]|nr:TIGR03936 family radical SAM-associated protein [Dehalococcoidales bacterium]